MLPDVINEQAQCLYLGYAKNGFNLLEGILQTYTFLKYNSSCIE